MTKIDELSDEIDEAVREYRRIYPEPYDLPPNLALATHAIAEARRLEVLAEGRRALGLNAIFMAEIIDTDEMAVARADYLASFAEAFVADAFDAGETTLEALVARARRIREKS